MPEIVMIGGPNGAGKTTSAMTLLPDHLRIMEFVNADSIAAGLSPFNPDSAALLAGRLMLRRIHLLMEQGTSFAFETTMASRVFGSLLAGTHGSKYRMTTLFMYLNSPELALSRVADRVAKGGHWVPPDAVKRRYKRGLRNLFEIYIPLSDRWYLHDSSTSLPELVAEGTGESMIVYNKETWDVILHNLGESNEPI